MAVACYASLRSLAQSLGQIQQPYGVGRLIINQKLIDDLRSQVQFILQFLEDLPHQALTLKIEALTREIKVLAYETELLVDAELVGHLHGRDHGHSSSDAAPQGSTEKVSSFTRDLHATIRKLELLVVDMKGEVFSYLENKVRSLVEFIDANSQTWRLQTEDFGEEITVIVVEIAILIDMHQHDGWSEGMGRVIQSLDSIEKRLMIHDMKAEIMSSGASSVHGDSSNMSSSGVVGLEEKIRWIMDVLTDNNKKLQIIPILGMGGIGKTTLARQVFEDKKIKRRFDRCMWCTVSKDYNERQILQSLLDDDSEKENRALGEKLYQNLHGHRYLIVLDDMWSIDPWDYLRKFLPDKKNFSRVIVTTRSNNVADSVGFKGGKKCTMELLYEDSSWCLLRSKSFNGRREYPPELESVGRKIAKSCKGLPLSLITIGGLLSKSMSFEYWEKVLQNMKRIVVYGDCMKVLSLSYDYLPMHLKPCFLYFRMYPEDSLINVQGMLARWLAEGFVKPILGKSLEDVAAEYMNELIDRNLISVGKIKTITGEVESCGIHDLLLELCLVESKKENFLLIPRSACCFGDSRCICGSKTLIEKMEVSEVFPSKTMSYIHVCRRCKMAYPHLHKSKFVTFSMLDKDKPFVYPTTARLAYLSDKNVSSSGHKFIFPLPLLHLWNLQILEVRCSRSSWRGNLTLPDEIWEMQQLRILVVYGVFWPKPRDNQVVMDQLQTLFTEELHLEKNVVLRIPNVKHLELSYYDYEGNPLLHNLGDFQELELLILRGLECGLRDSFFPTSLKKLVLSQVEIFDEDMGVLGALPNLEVLILDYCSMRNWSIVDGQFPLVKLLVLTGDNLKLPSVESSDFPSLEKLIFRSMFYSNIPSAVGDLPSLLSVHLDSCSEIAIASALEMLEEQRTLGNDTLELYVDETLVTEAGDYSTQSAYETRLRMTPMSYMWMKLSSLKFERTPFYRRQPKESIWDSCLQELGHYFVLSR